MIDIESQITKLDALYGDALDRLQSQAADADALDRRLRQILDQPDSEESIIEFHPERAMPPRIAFRALAMQLVRFAIEAKVATRDVSPLDYDDLLSWETEPHRTASMTMLEEVRLKIQYARTKSLRGFWDRYTVRVAPQRNPDMSATVAVKDLVESLAVELPETRIVPYLDRDHYRCMGMKIPKSVGDLEWVLQPPAISGLARTLHALVTLCRARGQATAAEMMQDTVQVVQTTLRTNHYRYRPREMFFAGDVLRIQMNRDHIEFRLTPDVFAVIRDEIVCQTNLTFVRAPRTYA